MNTPPAPHAAEWLPDPSGRHQLRWWDGQRWTDNVADGGQTATDAADPSWPAPVAAPAPQPQYAAQPQHAAAAPGTGVGSRHPNTMTAFILSLVGLLCCGILAPFALVMSNRARKDTSTTPGYEQNDGLLTAAWVISIIGTIYFAFWALYMILILVGVASFGISAV